MRKNNVIHTLGSSLLIAPLLVGCGSEGAGGSGMGQKIDVLPTCNAGQALSTDKSGVPYCKDLPAGTITIKACDATTQAYTSDGKTIECTEKGGGSTDQTLVNRVNMAESKIVQLNKDLDDLAKLPGGRASYVGVTAVTGANAGKFVAMGEMDGLNAANKLCDTAHAGSHMCHVYELYDTVVAGKLKEATASIPRSWIFFPAMNRRNTNGATANPTDGVVGTADNCGSGTYPTGDRQWFGVTAEWTTLANNARGFKFYYTSCAAQNYPIACCK